MREKEYLNVEQKILMFICLAAGLGGVSALPHKIRPVLISILGLFFILNIYHKKYRQCFPSQAFFLVFLVYIGVTSLFSYDKSMSLYWFYNYFCIANILFLYPNNTFRSKFLKYAKIMMIIFAVSILINVLLGNNMEKYFWLIINPTRSQDVSLAINNEISAGAYSGFAREKAEAAYLMNIGLASVFARYFAYEKLTKKDIAALLLFLTALMLTGKRTQFAVPIIVFLIFMIISRIKHKYIRIFTVCLLSIASLFIITTIIPDTYNIFLRFSDADNISNMGNRNILWEYLETMAENNLIFGMGFGSFNQFAYDHGLRVYGAMWNYYGHNCYYEMLAEIGIIGILLFIIFVIKALEQTHHEIIPSHINRSNKEQLYFAFYVQIYVLIYSVTGNPLYSTQQILLWLLSISMVTCISKERREENDK